MPATLYFRLYSTLVASFCVLGVCLTFVQPIYSVPDEFTHWNAAHSRTERLFGADGCVPTFNPDRNRRWHHPMPPFEQLDKTPLSCLVNGGDLYGDILTYPGALISRVLMWRHKDSALNQMQAILLTRLLQGLLFVVCLLRTGVLARRAGRNGSLLLAAFAMSPLLAQQAFGVSSDGVQLCFGLSMFCALMYWEHLRWPDVAAFFLFGWGATAKPFVLTCVLPCVVAGFWYAQLRTGDNVGIGEVLRRMWAALKITRRPEISTAMLWSGIALSGLTVAFAMHETTSTGVTAELPGVNRLAQMAGLTAHPLAVFDVVGAQTPRPWQLSSYTGPLGWLDTRLSAGTIAAFKRLVYLALAVELALFCWHGYRGVVANVGQLRRRLTQAIVPLFIALVGPVANVFFVAIVLYLVWTPVGAPAPLGVQARYFFASVMMLLGGVLGALGTVVVPGNQSETEPAEPHASVGRLPMWARRCSVATPVLVVALTFPYITRVFLDLAKRYY